MTDAEIKGAIDSYRHRVGFIYADRDLDVARAIEAAIHEKQKGKS